jgi:hypothetical protein
MALGHQEDDKKTPLTSIQTRIYIKNAEAMATLLASFSSGEAINRYTHVEM